MNPLASSVSAVGLGLRPRRPAFFFSRNRSLSPLMNIRGNSYQLKDKLKAGLVRPAEATE